MSFSYSYAKYSVNTILSHSPYPCLIRVISISFSDVEILEPPLRLTFFSCIYTDFQRFLRIQEVVYLGGWKRVRYPSTEDWITISIKKDLKVIFSGSGGKESACNVGGLGSFPGLGRSPAEENGYPLHYSGLENSMDYSMGLQRVGHN